MIARISEKTADANGRGKSFKKLSSYLFTGEKGELAKERVDWATTLNCAVSDPSQAWNEQAWVAQHANDLKRANGGRAGKLNENPVWHLVLSPAQDEPRDRDSMIAAAKSVLKHFGLHEHQAVLVFHKDTDQPHLHIMVNLVNPKTGISVDITRKPRVKIQEWADDYQKEIGSKACPQRTINREIRERLTNLWREAQQGLTGYADQIARDMAAAFLRASGRGVSWPRHWETPFHVAVMNKDMRKAGVPEAERSAFREQHRADWKQQYAKEREADRKTPVDPAPAYILRQLTRQQSTFTRHDLARAVAKQTGYAGAPVPGWFSQTGGAAALEGKDLERAQAAYATWAKDNPRPAAKYDFANYVEYVQDQHAARMRDAPASDQEAFEKFTALMAKVEASPDLVRLGDDDSARLSTVDMVATEQRLRDTTLAMAGQWSHPVPMAARDKAVSRAAAINPTTGERNLNAEQMAALGRILDADGICIIEGLAGTGKSTMLAYAVPALEAAGYRINGAALAGIAAENLEGSSIKAMTIAGLEEAWKHGHRLPDRNSVFIIDEAGMVGSRMMERVLSRIHEAGGKVILIGDRDQLQAMEAGGAMGMMVDTIGASRLNKVVRQQRDRADANPDWMRQASENFAAGKVADALAAYRQRGKLHGHFDKDEAKAALVETWLDQYRDGTGKSCMIFTHENKDARDINGRIREALTKSGHLGVSTSRMMKEERQDDETGAMRVETFVMDLARNDRIVFTKRDKDLEVKNGTLGTVVSISGDTLKVQLDAKGKDGPRVVTVDLENYNHFRPGYAVSIHKSQGVTVDRAHLLATNHMDAHLAYVGGTRHREDLQIHYGHANISGAATAGDERLAHRLGRVRRKDTTLNYLTPQQARAIEQRAERREVKQAAQARAVATTRGKQRVRPMDSGKGGARLSAGPNPRAMTGFAKSARRDTSRTRDR